MTLICHVPVRMLNLAEMVCLDVRVNDMARDLVALGFTEASSAEYSDKPARGVLYYGRIHDGQTAGSAGTGSLVVNHQRVSLITHPTSGRGEFLQAVVQVFDKAPTVGRPKGKLPTLLHASGPCCWEDLLATVMAIYSLPTKS